MNRRVAIMCAPADRASITDTRHAPTQVEPHLIHVFEEDFYGEELRFLVCGYVRPERSFPSLGQCRPTPPALLCFCGLWTSLFKTKAARGSVEDTGVLCSNTPQFHTYTRTHPPTTNN